MERGFAATAAQARAGFIALAGRSAFAGGVALAGRSAFAGDVALAGRTFAGCADLAGRAAFAGGVDLAGRAAFAGSAGLAGRAALAGAADVPTGLDINPRASDRIRYVNTNDENARLNQDSGALAGNDTDLTHAITTTIIGAAYDVNLDGAG